MLVCLGGGVDAAAQGGDSAAAPPGRPSQMLPPVEERTLANGIPVAVMRDTSAPFVSVGTVFDVDPALDPPDQPALGEVTRALLNSGTVRRTAREIAEAAAALDGTVQSTFLHVRRQDLDGALALLADQLRYSVFPESGLEFLKASLLAGVRGAKGHPRVEAGMLFKRLLFGADHPYARQQTEASITALTRDDVVAFYQRYFRPPNVRFVVVGDIGSEAIVAKLNRHFGTWEAGTPARAQIPPPPPTRPTIYLYDRPGLEQSVVWIGGLGPRRDTPDYAALSVATTILGGAEQSRLNENLRERHSYTRGAQAELVFRPVPQPGTFAAVATVKAAVTDSALIELLRELRAIRGARPITAEEFAPTRAELAEQLGRELGTISQRAAALMETYAYHLPRDYYQTLAAELPAVTRAAARAAARAHIAPDRFIAVVVGDRATVEPALRAAKLAPVVVVDSLGTPLAIP